MKKVPPLPRRASNLANTLAGVLVGTYRSSQRRTEMTSTPLAIDAALLNVLYCARSGLLAITADMPLPFRAKTTPSTSMVATSPSLVLYSIVVFFEDEEESL